MRVNSKSDNIKNKEASILIKTVLFGSIFLFAVSLEATLFSTPKGGFGIVVRALIIFVFTVIITGVMINYGSRNVLRLGVIISWLVTILLVII